MRNNIRTKRVLPAALALAAVTGAAGLAVALLAGHPIRPGTVHAAPSPSPVPVPSGALTLVAGTRPADGIEVGYPHTTVGAISAAAEYLDAVVSTLDPDYAASVTRTAGDPADPSLPAQLAASTVRLRADLQLPTSGPIDPPTAFLTSAQMYQLRQASADDAVVLLLTESTFINARGGTAQTTGVFPVRMRWTGGDWKLASIGAAGRDYSGLAAAPDTQGAVDHGWLPLIDAPGGVS